MENLTIQAILEAIYLFFHLLYFVGMAECLLGI
ncbi:unnamed protein product, partial [marine sediment metagenome]